MIKYHHAKMEQVVAVQTPPTEAKRIRFNTAKPLPEVIFESLKKLFSDK